jgi:hypothetical protein
MFETRWTKRGRLEFGAPFFGKRIEKWLIYWLKTACE